MAHAIPINRGTDCSHVATLIVIEWESTRSTTGQDGYEKRLRMIKAVSNTLTGLNFLRDTAEAKSPVIPK